jgi:SEL1 protein
MKSWILLPLFVCQELVQFNQKPLGMDLEIDAILDILKVPPVAPIPEKRFDLWSHFTLEQIKDQTPLFDWSFLPLDLEPGVTLPGGEVPEREQALLRLHSIACTNYTRALETIGSITLYGLYDTQPSPQHAFIYHQRLADLNSLLGYRVVGSLYASGMGIPRSYAKALIYTTFAAYGGDIPALHTMGYWHHSGIGVPKHCTRAYVYYEKVATYLYKEYQSGPPGGKTFPKEMKRLVDGLYGTKNTNSEGVRESDILLLYRLQAEAGDIVPQLMLGQYYYTGTSVATDFEKALEYFQMAVKNPNRDNRRAKVAYSSALGYLGMMYLRGEGCEVDYAEARSYFEKGIELDNGMSFTGLALMYLHGLGLQKDHTRAMELLNDASSVSHVFGKVLLAEQIIQSGKDVARAIPLLEFAAKRHHIIAHYHLGILHYSSNVVESHCRTALTYLKSFVEHVAYDDEVHVREAESLTKKGHYTPAMIKYALLAERGYEVAQFNAAWILENVDLRPLFPYSEETTPAVENSPIPIVLKSDKVTQMKHALVLYQRSANQGFVDSRVRVGDLYYYGYGWDVGSTLRVQKPTKKPTQPIPRLSSAISTMFHPPLEPDYQTALGHYIQASENEYVVSSVAMYNVAFMYQYGLGTTQDLHLAKRYFDLCLTTNPGSMLPVQVSMTVLYAEWIVQDIKRWFWFKEESEEMDTAAKRTFLINIEIKDLESSLIAIVIGILTLLLFVRYRLLRRVE